MENGCTTSTHINEPVDNTNEPASGTPVVLTGKRVVTRLLRSLGLLRFDISFDPVAQAQKMLFDVTSGGNEKA